MSFILLGILNSQTAATSVAGFDLLETSLITTSTSSVTFSNLNTYSQYKHLQLRITARQGFGNLLMTFNSDTGSNYASHRLISSGTLSSGASTSASSIVLGQVATTSQTTNVFASFVVDILDFSSTNKNTTIRSLGGVVDTGTSYSWVEFRSGLWNNTSAVTSLTIGNNGNLVSGSRISLYGIA